MEDFLKSKVEVLSGMMEERRRESKALAELLAEKGLVTAEELAGRVKKLRAVEEQAVAFMNEQMGGL